MDGVLEITVELDHYLQHPLQSAAWFWKNLWIEYWDNDLPGYIRDRMGQRDFTSDRYQMAVPDDNTYAKLSVKYKHGKLW
jgi:hypothetical protein